MEKFLPSQTYCYGENVPHFVAILKLVQVFKKVTNMRSCLVSAPMYYRSKNFCAALR